MKSKTRLLSAIVLLPILVAGVYWLPTEWFTALLALAAIATQVEFYRMFRLGNVLTFTGAALGLLIMAAHFKGMFLEASALSLMVITVVRLFRRAEPQGAIFDIGTAFFGLMYIPGLLGFQAQLHEIGPGYVLFVFAAVWGGDAAAYYLGGTFGKRKLYPAISPNKTWVGVGGSLAGGLAAGIAIKLLLLPKLSLEAAAVTGLALGAIAVLGDLVESLLKRDAGVKDSGSYIPGHGGLLDKLDGSLFASPAMLLLLSAFGITGGWSWPF